MEVGEAVTYVDPTGVVQDALVAKLEDGKANLIVIATGGAEDHFGKNRVELKDVTVGDKAPCVCDLDSYKPATPKKKKKKKAK
jgi:hypothetical protein